MPHDRDDDQQVAEESTKDDKSHNESLESQPKNVIDLVVILTNVTLTSIEEEEEIAR